MSLYRVICLSENDSDTGQISTYNAVLGNLILLSENLRKQKLMEVDKQPRLKKDMLATVPQCHIFYLSDTLFFHTSLHSC